MGVPELAATALALSVEEWGKLGLDNADPETTPDSDLSVVVERMTALLLIRVVAIVSQPGEYNDFSTSTITRTALMRQEPWTAPITDEIIEQLRRYVRVILSRYNDVPYHCRDHAFHVVLSCNKLMDMMLQQKQTNTFGLRQDPLSLFSLLFAALIHDVEHQGIPNHQLANEGCPFAVLYNDQSIAENRSLYVGFSEFLKDDYKELRQIIFSSCGVSAKAPLAINSTASSPYHRFRAQVISLILTTDISSPERTQIVKAKFIEAFVASQEQTEAVRNEKVPRSESSSATSTDPENSDEFCHEGTGQGKAPVVVEAKQQISPPLPTLRSRKGRRRQGMLTTSRTQHSKAPERVSVPGATKPVPRQKFGSMRRSMDLCGATLEIYGHALATKPGDEEPDELKASVILEVIMTAADVAHNLQGFEQMVKWSDKLHLELRRAFLMGRGSDPQKNWYENQIGFLDFYLMPLAKRMENTGVFGCYAGMFAATVKSNKETWLHKGQNIADSIIAKAQEMKLEDFGQVKDTEQEESMSSDDSNETPVMEAKDTSTPAAVHLPPSSFVVILLFLLLAVGLQTVHLSLSIPVKRGQPLLPGTWLIKCGLIPSFLTGCENAYFNVDSRGFATFYNANYEVEWEMQGAVCAESDADCVSGLVLNEEKKIEIGSKVVRELELYADSADLAPWPFAYEPNVRKRVIQGETAGKQAGTTVCDCMCGH